MRRITILVAFLLATAHGFAQCAGCGSGGGGGGGGTWGSITGTLSSQTDLWNALSSVFPPFHVATSSTTITIGPGAVPTSTGLVVLTTTATIVNNTDSGSGSVHVRWNPSGQLLCYQDGSLDVTKWTATNINGGSHCTAGAPTDSSLPGYEITVTSGTVGSAPAQEAIAGAPLCPIPGLGLVQDSCFAFHLAPVPFGIYTSGPVSDPGGPNYFELNNASGALTFNLPDGTSYYQRCFRNASGKSGAITIAVTTNNSIDKDGAAGTTSTGTLVSGGALGDAVCLVADGSRHWYAYVQKGSWTNN